VRRRGVLLFAAVPVVITAAAYFLVPTDAADSPAAPAVSAAQKARQDARSRAEQERAEDDKLIASLPPGLVAPAKKELAQRIVASAENSTLNWRGAYRYSEDIGDGQGYTAGIIGFCSGTHDMLALVEN
jgi:chitosanase